MKGIECIAYIKFLALLFFCCSVQSLHGQACEGMVYAHENQIDPNPIEQREITGKGIDPSGAEIRAFCIGIFTESEHRLAQYTQSDEHGNFSASTANLPDGDYRLVSQSTGFCPANARIRIKAHSRQKKTLLVHMDVRGIDSCSYVELIKRNKATANSR
jgi:hypothetical protein